MNVVSGGGSKEEIQNVSQAPREPISAGEATASIPTHLIIIIFSQIQEAGSLVKLMGVNRRWCFIISTSLPFQRTMIIAQAKLLISKMEDPATRVNYLLQIAKSQMTVSDVEGVNETFACAKVVAGNNLAIKQVILRSIAVFQVKSGNIEKANQIAESITGPSNKQAILRSIAVFQVKSGNIEKAKQLAESITTPFDKVLALIKIAVAELKYKDKGAAREIFTRAKAIAETALPTIEGSYQKDTALKDIGMAQAKAGVVDDAKKTAVAISKNPEKICVLIEIAVAQAKARDIHGAKETLALAASEVQSIVDKEEKVFYTARLAVAQAKSFDVSGAKLTVNTIPKGHSTDSALMEIAVVQAGVKNIVGAKKTIEAITDPFLKENALVKIAVAQVEAGNIEGAKETLKVIQIPDLRIRLLLKIFKSLKQSL